MVSVMATRFTFQNDGTSPLPFVQRIIMLILSFVASVSTLWNAIVNQSVELEASRS